MYIDVLHVLKLVVLVRCTFYTGRFSHTFDAECVDFQFFIKIYAQRESSLIIVFSINHQESYEMCLYELELDLFILHFLGMD